MKMRYSFISQTESGTGMDKGTGTTFTMDNPPEAETTDNRLRLIFGAVLLMGVCILQVSHISAATLSADELLAIVHSGKFKNLPQTIISPKDGAEMILIPAGEFRMGIPADSTLATKFSSAVPEHTVFLDAYYVDKYEVTNEQYKKYLSEKGARRPLFWSDNRYNARRQPIVGISYGDAVSYALWAGKRLPTEAEWEKSARGTDARLYPWGSTFDPSRCNAYAARIEHPVEVGRFPKGASPYGIMDMAGNVSEWVFDLYGHNYYRKSPYKNPQGPPGEGVARITRGGDYKSDPPYVTCVARFQAGAYSAFPNIGFRCAVFVSDIETLFNPQLAKQKQKAVSSGVTVISQKGGRADSISKSSVQIPLTRGDTSRFKPVRYFKELDFDGKRCRGRTEISKSARMGTSYWKVYHQSPGIITQAQYFNKTDELQLHIEPVYDEKGVEKQVRLYNQQGRLVYRSERVFSKTGRPIRGILYSAGGDYVGEEKF